MRILAGNLSLDFWKLQGCWCIEQILKVNLCVQKSGAGKKHIPQQPWWMMLLDK